MTILKDLLALNAAKPVAEETLVEARGIQGLIDRWIDQNRAYSWEGRKGIRNLEALVKALDYHDLESFFEDNSGAIEAIVEWIGTIGNLEWRQALEDELGPEDDEEDDDDK